MLKYVLEYRVQKDGFPGPIQTHEFTARGDKEAREKSMKFIRKEPLRISVQLLRVIPLHEPR